MAAEVGQKAPDFQAPDTSRAVKSLGDFAGKTVVLAFFPGAFTGVCTKEACTLRDSAAELNGLNAEVVGVTVDSIFSQKAWADANSLQFTLVSDFKREMVNAYGTALPNFAGMEGYTSSKRSVFVIDKGGVVRYAETTENPGVEPNYEAIKAAVAAAK